MNIRRFEMNHGVILGFSLVAVAAVLYSLGIQDVKRPIFVFSINTLLLTGYLVYSIKQFRDSISGGFISYSQSVKIGVTVAVFSSIIVGLWKVLFINYIFPEYISIYIEITQQKILELDNEFPGWIDNIDEKLEQIQESAVKQFKPHQIFFQEIISKAIGGLLLSLIISFFIRKKDPNTII